jgi:hypothetical protein
MRPPPRRGERVVSRAERVPGADSTSRRCQLLRRRGGGASGVLPGSAPRRFRLSRLTPAPPPGASPLAHACGSVRSPATPPRGEHEKKVILPGAISRLRSPARENHRPPASAAGVPSASPAFPRPGPRRCQRVVTDLDLTVPPRSVAKGQGVAPPRAAHGSRASSRTDPPEGASPRGRVPCAGRSPEAVWTRRNRPWSLRSRPFGLLHGVSSVPCELSSFCPSSCSPRRWWAAGVEPILPRRA